MDTQNFTAKLPAQVRKLGYYIDGAAREAGDRKTLVREAPGYLVPVSEVALCTRQDLVTVGLQRKIVRDRLAHTADQRPLA